MQVRLPGGETRALYVRRDARRYKSSTPSLFFMGAVHLEGAEVVLVGVSGKKVGGPDPAFIAVTSAPQPTEISTPLESSLSIGRGYHLKIRGIPNADNLRVNCAKPRLVSPIWILREKTLKAPGMPVVITQPRPIPRASHRRGLDRTGDHLVPVAIECGATAQKNRRDQNKSTEDQPLDFHSADLARPNCRVNDEAGP